MGDHCCQWRGQAGCTDGQFWPDSPVKMVVAVRRAGAHRSYNPSTRYEATMSILWTIIIGLICGALAKLVMPGKDPGGIIITILLGIVGAFVGTFIGRALGMYGPGQAAGW